MKNLLYMMQYTEVTDCGIHTIMNLYLIKLSLGNHYQNHIRSVIDMTIDEAIECERNHKLYPEYHEKIAEWLEELKEMRNNQGQIADFWYQEGIKQRIKT